MSDEEVDPAALLGEFTLEDTHDHLKELQDELQHQLDELISVASNNEVQILSSSTTPEIIESSQSQFLQSLIRNLRGMNTSAEPMADTEDLYELTIHELEDQVRKMEVLEAATRQEMNQVKSKITYLESEKNGLEKMKEACVGAIEDVANSTYDAETAMASRLFAQVKKDLLKLVEITTEDNEDFQQLLASLTSAYMKGGNEVYVDVGPDSTDCVQLLIEADIAMYHRNDKSKIRLIDLV